MFLVSTSYSLSIWILRGVRPFVDFDPADKGRIYVKATKTLNVQVGKPSFLSDNFDDQYVLRFDSTARQEATKT